MSPNVFNLYQWQQKNLSVVIRVVLSLQTAPQAGTGSGFLPCPSHVPHAKYIIYISINRANCLELWIFMYTQSALMDDKLYGVFT